MIRKIFILALGLVALMAMPAAAQYENPTTTTTSVPTTDTTTVPGSTTTTTPATCDEFLRDDAYRTPVNTPFNPGAPGVFVNDDICPPVNGYTILSTTTHGSVTPNADGSFTYTPDAGYIGTDSFVYEANHDGNSRKAAKSGLTAIVTITIVDDSGVGANTGNQGGNQGGTLVRTGSNTDELVKIGGLLLVAGGAITLVAGKRRRRTAA